MNHTKAWAKPAEDIPEIKAFVEHLGNGRRHGLLTIKNYEADLQKFASFLSEREKLIHADKDDVRKFVAALFQDRNYKPITVRRMLASIRGFYEFVIEELKLRTDNPAAKIEAPKIMRKLPRTLTETEVGKIIDHRKAGRHEEFTLRNRAMLELLYASGIRKSELLSLNVDSIDFDRKLMNVTGKGGKERIVFLNKAACRAVKTYMRVRPRVADPALFLSQRKTRLGLTQAWEVFSEALTLSGVNKQASPHTFRHSFATHMLENDADLVTIKDMLGHESLATTQIYTNLTEKHKRRVYDASHPRDRNLS